VVVFKGEKNMAQSGPTLPPVPVAPFVRQLPVGAATLPLSVFDVNDVNNVACPLNAGNAAFVANFTKSSDLGVASPLNANHVGNAHYPSAQNTYNVYLS
jgi:hypothetical protein